MAFRIPVELQETAKAFNVRKWVESKDFPKQQYFETVDIFREQLERFDPDGEVNNKHLATILACTIDTEGALATHALATGIEIGTAEKWLQICTAAAWVVLQGYANAVKKGEWST